MKHVHFFQYNVPSENQYCGRTNCFINIVSEWGGNTLIDGKPIGIYSSVVNPTKYELVSVTNWALAFVDIDSISEKHFAEVARLERLNESSALLTHAVLE